MTDPDSAIAHFADGEQRLRAIVDHLLDALVPLDAVLLTGDLTDHGTTDEYDRLVAQLARLPCPWFALPGNHDRRPEFDDALLAGTAWAPPIDGPCNSTVDVV
ncbi:MAG: metallophosphoesterase, partial [Aeromicrobium sp.]